MATKQTAASNVFRSYFHTHRTNTNHNQTQKQQTRVMQTHLNWVPFVIELFCYPQILNSQRCMTNIHVHTVYSTAGPILMPIGTYIPREKVKGWASEWRSSTRHLSKTITPTGSPVDWERRGKGREREREGRERERKGEKEEHKITKLYFCHITGTGILHVAEMGVHSSVNHPMSVR